MHPRGLPAHLARLDRTLVFGILNVTPDSFSDGGRFQDPRDAVAHGLELVARGADVVDVGGESTRPGALRPQSSTELDRVLPVVAALSEAGVVVSVDTMRAQVAEQALGHGAAIVNDVSGGQADPAMAEMLADRDVPYVVMHWRGHSDRMAQLARYGEVVREVCSELVSRMNVLTRAGVDAERIVLDPGLGFAKDAAHNWALLRALPTLRALGRPVLVGASRKRFLGELLAGPDGPRPVADRDAATDAVTVLASLQGAWAVRVHDPTHARDLIAVSRAWAGHPDLEDATEPRHD